MQENEILDIDITACSAVTNNQTIKLTVCAADSTIGVLRIAETKQTKHFL